MSKKKTLEEEKCKFINDFTNELKDHIVKKMIETGMDEDENSSGIIYVTLLCLLASYSCSIMIKTETKNILEDLEKIIEEYKQTTK